MLFLKQNQMLMFSFADENLSDMAQMEMFTYDVTFKSFVLSLLCLVSFATIILCYLNNVTDFAGFENCWTHLTI